MILMRKNLEMSMENNSHVKKNVHMSKIYSQIIQQKIFTPSSTTHNKSIIDKIVDQQSVFDYLPKLQI